LSIFCGTAALFPHRRCGERPNSRSGTGRAGEQDAARALVPAAGRYAGSLFGIGLLGSALLALPVLLATVAYVVGAEFDWPRGLSENPRRAPAFYAVAAVAMALGAAFAFAGYSPIRLLFLAPIAGGIGTPIGLVLLVLVASDRG